MGSICSSKEKDEKENVEVHRNSREQDAYRQTPDERYMSEDIDNLDRFSHKSRAMSFVSFMPGQQDRTSLQSGSGMDGRQDEMRYQRSDAKPIAGIMGNDRDSKSYSQPVQQRYQPNGSSFNDPSGSHPQPVKTRDASFKKKKEEPEARFAKDELDAIMGYKDLTSSFDSNTFSAGNGKTDAYVVEEQFIPIDRPQGGGRGGGAGTSGGGAFSRNLPQQTLFTIQQPCAQQPIALQRFQNALDFVRRDSVPNSDTSSVGSFGQFRALGHAGLKTTANKFEVQNPYAKANARGYADRIGIAIRYEEPEDKADFNRSFGSTNNLNWA